MWFPHGGGYGGPYGVRGPPRPIAMTQVVLVGNGGPVSINIVDVRTDLGLVDSQVFSAFCTFVYRAERLGRGINNMHVEDKKILLHECLEEQRLPGYDRLNIASDVIARTSMMELTRPVLWDALIESTCRYVEESTKSASAEVEARVEELDVSQHSQQQNQTTTTVTTVETGEDEERQQRNLYDVNDRERRAYGRQKMKDYQAAGRSKAEAKEMCDEIINGEWDREVSQYWERKHKETARKKGPIVQSDQTLQLPNPQSPDQLSYPSQQQQSWQYEQAQNSPLRLLQSPRSQEVPRQVQPASTPPFAQATSGDLIQQMQPAATQQQYHQQFQQQLGQYPCTARTPVQVPLPQQELLTMQPPQCGGQQMMYQKVTETIMAATQPNLRQQQLQHQRPPQWTNFQAQAQQHQGIAQQPHQLAYGQQVQGYQTQPALTYGQQQGLLPAPAMSQDYLSDSMAGLSVVGTAIGEKKTRKKKKVIA